MKQEKLEETSSQMSSASFMKEPYPSTRVMHQIKFNDFFGDIDYFLQDDHYKIIVIIVSDTMGVFAHKTVVKYIINILNFSKEDFKDLLCWIHRS